VRGWFASAWTTAAGSALQQQARHSQQGSCMLVPARRPSLSAALSDASSDSTHCPCPAAGLQAAAAPSGRAGGGAQRPQAAARHSLTGSKAQGMPAGEAVCKPKPCTGARWQRSGAQHLGCATPGGLHSNCTLSAGAAAVIWLPARCTYASCCSRMLPGPLTSQPAAGIP
jgi:hypothetical protein